MNKYNDDRQNIVKEALKNFTIFNFSVDFYEKDNNKGTDNVSRSVILKSLSYDKMIARNLALQKASEISLDNEFFIDAVPMDSSNSKGIELLEAKNIDFWEKDVNSKYFKRNKREIEQQTRNDALDFLDTLTVGDFVSIRMDNIDSIFYVFKALDSHSMQTMRYTTRVSHRTKTYRFPYVPQNVYTDCVSISDGERMFDVNSEELCSPYGIEQMEKVLLLVNSCKLSG